MPRQQQSSTMYMLVCSGISAILHGEGEVETNPFVHSALSLSSCLADDGREGILVVVLCVVYYSSTAQNLPSWARRVEGRSDSRGK